MRIPILTYHAMKIAGTDYAGNDLVALASDLETITRSGFHIVPLPRLVERWLDNPEVLESHPMAAISCDDGPDFDFRDLPHPDAGLQRGVLGILRDFARRLPGKQPDLHVTSFVIASPAARAELDRRCMLGRGWWSDDWWSEAAGSGLMAIANHSWDHNHELVTAGTLPNCERGTFRPIANRRAADFQVRQSAEFLLQRCPNPGTKLFAYPYGEAPAYLVEEYFPRFGPELGIEAAFTTEARALARADSRWALPRYVFGRDWTSPEGLEKLLASALPA